MVKIILSLSSFYFSDSITITFTENDELSNFLTSRYNKSFIIFKHTLLTAVWEHQRSNIAILRVLIIEHDAKKLQLLTGIMPNLWKDHAFSVYTLIPVSRLVWAGMSIEIKATAYTA